MPSVSVGAVYTDNLFLVPDNETSDVVTRIDPGILITHQSERVDLRADYTYTYLHYNEADDSDASFSAGNATLDLALIKDVLTLETLAKQDQRLVDPEAGVFFTNVPIVDNRTDETRLEASPHLLTEVLGIGVDARYTLGRVTYDDAGLLDVDFQETETTLSGEKRNRGLSWEVYHQYQVYSFENPPDNKSQLAYLTLTQGFRQSGDFYVFGSLGLESDYEDFSNAGLEDTYWEIGLRRQTDRTLIEAAFGERNFGSTFNARARRELNNGNIEISYSEDPSVQEDIYEQRPPETTPQPPELPGDFDRIGVGERFVYKLLAASLVREIGRNEFQVLLYDQERDEIINPNPVGPPPMEDSETETGVVLAVSRQLGRRTRVGLSGSFASREFTSGNDDEISEFRGFANYAVGERLGLEGWLARNEQRGSDVANNDYEEFQAGLTATYTFR